MGGRRGIGRNPSIKIRVQLLLQFHVKHRHWQNKSARIALETQADVGRSKPAIIIASRRSFRRSLFLLHRFFFIQVEFDRFSSSFGFILLDAAAAFAFAGDAASHRLSSGYKLRRGLSRRPAEKLRPLVQFRRLRRQRFLIRYVSFQVYLVHCAIYNSFHCIQKFIGFPILLALHSCTYEKKVISISCSPNTADRRFLSPRRRRLLARTPLRRLRLAPRRHRLKARPLVSLQRREKLRPTTRRRRCSPPRRKSLRITTRMIERLGTALQ